MKTRPQFRIREGISPSGRRHIGEVLEDEPYSEAAGVAAIREVEAAREQPPSLSTPVVETLSMLA